MFAIAEASPIGVLLEERVNRPINCNVIANFNKDGVIKSLHAFMQDVTEETLAKKSAIELQNNLESIQNISKIVIGKYEDGKYS